MNRLLATIAILSIAGCSPAAEEEAAAPADNVTEAAAAPQEEVPSLEGQWTVTQIQNAPLQQAYTMRANVGPDRLTIESDCVRKAWDYTQNRNVVSFTKAEVPSCGRVPTPDEEVIEKAIGNATIVIFSNEGQEAQFSGAGGSVTMTKG